MARIIYMGTPQFAVPTLEALDDHHQVVGVVTQPDRRAGRGRRLAMSPVKEVALARELPVFQPGTLHSAEALEHLVAWQPDLIVVAAFGQILRQPVLQLPAHGCLNVHASLLPRYRGAAPIPAAILAGDEITGVTIMRMDEGLDTGPILAQAELPIGPGDTTGSLTRGLAGFGARLLIETLPGWLRGEIEPRPQNEENASYCRMLRKEDGRLDWTQPAPHLERQIRAVDPWPGAYTTWRGQRLKVLHARVHADSPATGQPGAVVELGPDTVGAFTGRGILELVDVQLAGKKPMLASIFARGQRDFLTGVLGT
jgi:methionyl-tRNA formyltransferase